MKQIRIGIIGLGVIGSQHARQIQRGFVPQLALTALADSQTKQMETFNGVRKFCSLDDLLQTECVDAVLISTPHPLHVPLAVKALECGLHVLVEKPLASHTADCERLFAFHAFKSRLTLATMLHYRTHPVYSKVRELLRLGTLGELLRVQWIATEWFRTDAYYKASPWRGTWSGEGGGVLLNQSVHQLDLLWWLFGMPSKVRAFCFYGKHHNIEVEDEVTAFLEYQSGMTAVFIASTGEYPGTDRLEIVGTMGKLEVSRGIISYQRNHFSSKEFSLTGASHSKPPKAAELPISINDSGPSHIKLLENFADAILEGIPLIAPAAEAAHCVELANAFVLSSVTNQSVSFPLDSLAYEQFLSNKIKPRT